MIEIVPNWHPLWVHFPIALLSVAALLFWLTSLKPDHHRAAMLTSVARWNLALGLVSLAPTLATGLLAYNSVAHDSAGHVAMTRHLWVALLASLLFVLAGLLAWRDRRRAAGAAPLLALLLLPAWLALMTTGYLGAENVYRHGIGVERLPDPDDHHHGHNGHGDHDHDGAPPEARQEHSHPSTEMDGHPHHH